MQQEKRYNLDNMYIYMYIILTTSRFSAPCKSAVTAEDMAPAAAAAAAAAAAVSTTASCAMIAHHQLSHFLQPPSAQHPFAAAASASER